MQLQQNRAALLALFVGCAALFGPTRVADAHPSMEIGAGTMQLGGVTTAALRVFSPASGPTAFGGRFAFEPSVGYFLTEAFEVVAQVGAAHEVADAQFEPATDLSFGFGVRFYVPLEHWYLFAGASAGFAFHRPVNQVFRRTFALGIPLGVLLPLNRFLGLELGTHVRYVKYSGDNGGSEWTVPLGYLGVSAFF